MYQLQQQYAPDSRYRYYHAQQQPRSVEPIQFYTIRQQQRDHQMRLAFWQTKCLLQWANEKRPLFTKSRQTWIDLHVQKANEIARQTDQTFAQASQRWEKRDAEKQATSAPIPSVPKVVKEEDVMVYRGLRDVLKDIKQEEQARKVKSQIPTDVLAKLPDESIEETTKRSAVRLAPVVVEPDDASFLL